MQLETMIEKFLPYGLPGYSLRGEPTLHTAFHDVLGLVDPVSGPVFRRRHKRDKPGRNAHRNAEYPQI